MSTRTKWIVGLLAINIALLPFTFAFASKRTAAGPPNGWLDCCQETAGGAPYCCVNCCWLTQDCGAGLGCGRQAAVATTVAFSDDAEDGDRDER